MIERTSLSLLLKCYRMAAGLSQEALAQRADLSTRAISDLERGLHRSPRGTTLNLLASALSLSAQQRVLLLAAARPDLPDVPLEMAQYASPTEIPGLPTPPTAVVGRESESAELRALLQRNATRLVTVTGPSGVGKTRIALHVAHEIAPAYGDGALFVDLALIRDAGLVPSAVAYALQLREQGGTPLDQQIRSYLREKRMLLVLDNFEQVIESAPFVADLLTWCPNIAIIVTSRMPLRLRGEHAIQLAPLPLEDAIVLFRERAHSVRRGELFSVTDAAAICERVDCLPLAIEIVAGQVGLLSLPQILNTLDQHMGLELEGARDLPSRQRTMAAAINWGYDLLTPDQQRCFRALAVFVGGFTLDAACSVCWGDEVLRQQEALLILAGLVDVSLVHVETLPGGTTRFHLLELAREFAGNRLRAEGEEDACRRQHAVFFARLAETLNTVGFKADTRADMLAHELANARAALEWAQEQRQAEVGLRLAGFTRLWDIRGGRREARHWLATMLALDAQARAEHAPTAPDLLRVELLYGYARALLNSGDLEQAEAVAQEAIALAQQIDDRGALTESYATLGMVAQARGDLEQVASAFTTSVEYASQDMRSEGRYRALFRLGELARNRSDFTQAHTLMEEAMAGAQTAGNAWDCAVTMTMLAHLERQQHDNIRARPRYLESLKQFHAFGSSAFFAWCLEGYSALLGGEGRHAPAARLCAAAATLREQANAPLPAPERAAFEDTVNRAREALGAAQFTAEWSMGSSFTQAMAIAEAVKFG